MAEHDDAEHIDTLEDQEEPRRRKIPFWIFLLLALFILVGGFVVVSAATSPNTQNVTDSQAQDDQSDSEATDGDDSDPSQTTLLSDEAEETGEGADGDKDNDNNGDGPSASAPVDEPTATSTPIPVVPVTLPEEETCGNGICGDGENSDVCADDCYCKDNGICEASEGFGCRDCQGPEEEVASLCGSPCPTGECGGGLSCSDGICWDACTCGGDCSEDDDDEKAGCGPICYFCVGCEKKAEDNCSIWTVENPSAYCGC